MSVTDPSPDLGWRGRERASLERRGTPELTLCLAVVHHVCITGNVPVREFLDWLRSLDTRARDRVPRPRATRWCSGCSAASATGAIPTTTRAAFERALEERFTVERRAAGVGHPDALRSTPAERRASGAPRCTSAGCGRSRSPSRCSTCWGATRSSSSRAGARPATSWCSRSATRSCRRWSGALIVWALGGSARLRVVGDARARRAARRGARAAAGRRRCSAARRSPIPVALLLGAGARGAVRARRRRALVRHRALARAADRAAPVPRRLARARRCCSRARRRRGRGPGAARRRRSCTSCSTSCR